LKGLQLHHAESNKKTRATQGCSGKKTDDNTSYEKSIMPKVDEM
jgi:hypothetical protein